MELNISRLCSLTQRHLLREGKKYLIGVLAGMTIAVIITLLSAIGNGVINASSFIPTTIGFFLIGGAIITSSIFNELNKPDTGYQLMILPVSTLEKFISAWLISLPLFVIASISSIYLGIGIIKLTSLFGMTISGIFLLPNQLTELVQAFMIIHTIAFLGAATFKKNAFIKTALGSGIWSFAMAAVTGLAIWLYMQVIGANSYQVNTNVSINFSSINNSEELLSYIAFFAFTIFLWVVTYFKLKERTL